MISKMYQRVKTLSASRSYSSNVDGLNIYSVKEYVGKVLNMHEFAIKTITAMTLTGFAGLYLHVDKRFDDMKADNTRSFDEIKADTNKRFEQVDKRFEQVDKRFEQVDKRLDKIESDVGEIKNILLKEFSKNK